MDTQHIDTWKVGSNWGEKGPSVLYMFLNYGCAFFGDDGNRIGDWTQAKEGDLLLVCSKSRPVAIAEMKTPFKAYSEKDPLVPFCRTDRNFIGAGEHLILCKARFVLLDGEDNTEWRNEGRRRFCHHEKFPERVIKKWIELTERERKGDFSIKSEVRSLSGSNSEKPALISTNAFYRIPVYQRPYSWEEHQIQQVFEDLHSAYEIHESVFMGTMQLSNKIPLSVDEATYAYDVIDGQQRLTTFMILLCLLEKMTGQYGNDSGAYPRECRFITHVNRGSAQQDLEEFWDRMASEKDVAELFPEVEERNPYIRNAATIKNMLESYFFTEGCDRESVAHSLYAYLKECVLFVVIETRAGLSKTLKIFKSINTTGLDLGVDDLFKLRLYEHRKNRGDDENVFDRISAVYERVDDHNRKEIRYKFSMWDVLSVYQRVLFVKHGMARELYGFSVERFFDGLFDTLLGNQIQGEFKRYKDIELDVSDLERVEQCFEWWAEQYEKNEQLRIINNFISWDTRYPNVWNYTIVALFFGAIRKNQVFIFHRELFKLLVPPSLYWARLVNHVVTALIGIVTTLGSGVDGLRLLQDKKEANGLTGNAKDEFDFACTQELSGNPKWKNLICRLVEYLQSNKQQAEGVLYNGTDIEHIQCYTDDTDYERVHREWGPELNRMGNLVLLERDLNRSIGNNRAKKRSNYEKSRFESVKLLINEVDTWSKEKAEKRRADLHKLIWDYLCGND